MENENIKISVQITREQNNKLEELAKQNNLKKSELIRQSIVANSTREAFMTKAICLLCQLDSAAKKCENEKDKELLGMMDTKFFLFASKKKLSPASMRCLPKRTAAVMNSLVLFLIMHWIIV